MSHVIFEEIFQRFKENFPPVSTPKEARLELKTEEIITMITNLEPKAQVPPDGIFSFLKAQGYTFYPKEENETVTFYWLVGGKD